MNNIDKKPQLEDWDKCMELLLSVSKTTGRDQDDAFDKYIGASYKYLLKYNERFVPRRRPE